MYMEQPQSEWVFRVLLHELGHPQTTPREKKRTPIQVVATGSLFIPSLTSFLKSPVDGRLDVYNEYTTQSEALRLVFTDRPNLHVHCKTPIRGLWNYPAGLDILHTQSLKPRIDCLCLGSEGTTQILELAAALGKMQQGGIIALQGNREDCRKLLETIGARCLFASFIGSVYRMPPWNGWRGVVP